MRGLGGALQIGLTLRSLVSPHSRLHHHSPSPRYTQLCPAEANHGACPARLAVLLALVCSRAAASPPLPWLRGPQPAAAAPPTDSRKRQLLRPLRALNPPGPVSQHALPSHRSALPHVHAAVPGDRALLYLTRPPRGLDYTQQGASSISLLSQQGWLRLASQ